MSGYTEITLLQYELEKLRARVAELEERRCEVCGYSEHHREHTGCLRKQVSSLKAELREICAAIDDPACDLTLTAAECIKKLKAENESLKLDAERYRWLKNNDSPIGIYSNADFDDCYYIHEPDEAIDAAMAKGEKGS